MSYSTATGLHEAVLLMKHKPSDIGRITNALFMADERTLKEIPRQAYQHYFDEIGIVVLNWMGRGESASIQEALETLTKSVFGEPEMKQLPNLTIKQRMGLQLRVICAQMTLYLKVQNSIRYNAMLTGVRNEVSRTVLQVLYEKVDKSTGFGFDFGGIDYQTVWQESLALLPTGRHTVKENVHHHLRELVKKGLALEERTGSNVTYQLSERGVREARFHFGGSPENIVATSDSKPVKASPMGELAQELEQEAGAILVILINKRDYKMSEISRLVELNGTGIILSFFSRRSKSRDDQYHVTLKLDADDATPTVKTLERFGYEIESVHNASEVSTQTVEAVAHSDMSNLLRYSDM